MDHKPPQYNSNEKFILPSKTIEPVAATNNPKVPINSAIKIVRLELFIIFRLEDWTLILLL